MIVPIFAIDQQNVDVAMELAMLKAVVENVHQRSEFALLDRIQLLASMPGMVALRGNVDGHASSRAISSGSSPNSSAVPLRSNAEWQPRRVRPYPRESTSTWNPLAESKRASVMASGVLPDAAGREIANADHRLATDAAPVPSPGCRRSSRSARPAA